MSGDIGRELDQLCGEILESYETRAAISHLSLDAFPRRDEIIDILHRFRDILFPGYFEPDGRPLETPAFSTRKKMLILYEKLHRQLYNALNLLLDRKKTEDEEAELSETTRKYALAILKKIPALRELLLADVKAAYEGDPAASSLEEVIFSYPGIFALMTHRIAHAIFLMKIPFIPRIMSEYAHNLTGIDIHPGAEIGPSLFIDHGTGVVIGGTAVIGEHVRLYQGVTLGALAIRDAESLRGTKRHPTLQDHVVVYAGATILGGDTVIEEGVVIGSNAFITESVRKKAKAPDAVVKPDENYVFNDWVI